MKKSLLVLAVASVVPMLAQAQTNVTLYGRIDNGLSFEKYSKGATAAGGSAVLMNSGVQSSNRWGLRGSEDLGGGLKAVFNLEAGFDADTGTSGFAGGITNIFGRRSVVGLEGGFGTLLLGRDYDPLFRVLLGSDTLGLGHYNNVHTIFGATGSYGATATPAYGVRISNGIHYVSPSFGGFVVRGAYGFSEKFTAPKSNGRSISLAGEFSTGPIYVGVGYRQNDVSTTTTSLNNKHLAVGGRYNFGAFAINAGFGKNDAAGGTAADNKAIWVGADAQVGPGRLHLQGGIIDPTGSGKANSIGITYNYPVSKRTTVYATAGVLRNNATAQYGLSTSSTAVVAAGGLGSDVSGITLGVGHNF